MAKIVFALVFTLIVSASIPAPVFAAPKPTPVTLGGFSLTPTLGGYFFAGSEQRDATQSYGLKVGYDMIGKSMTDSLGMEGTLNYFTTKSKTDASDATGYLFRLDAIYPFVLGVKWMPFLAVGAGGIVIDNVSHADKSPLFNYGAGLKYFMEDYLAVRVDARHLVVYNNVNARNNFEVGIGLSYYFGKERKKKTVPPPATKPKEKEDAKNGKKSDGTATKSAPAIPALEEIAKTAGGDADEKKSALKGEISAVPPFPPLVPSIALAPLPALEPAAKPLFQAEAPKESAGEKPVLKAVTPGMIAVGQAVGKKVVRKLTVEFDINSSHIKPEFYKKLREIADIMKSSADASARIEGHADSSGELSYNIKLSEQRAQSVRSSLIKLSGDPGRIFTVGYGPSGPIADNATIEGRQKNRRAVTLVTLTVSE